MSAASLIQSAPAEVCRPWLRHLLDRASWQALAQALAADPLRLMGMWANTTQIHALFLDETTMAAMVASCPVEAGAYPALSPVRPGAAWYERMIQDLWGHHAEAGHDARPWLDHGHWLLTHPLSARPGPPLPQAEPPTFLGAEDDVRMRLPIGPVTGLIEEAAHLRLTLDGPRTAAAEARLGYAHRGVLALMRGRPARDAARFAARLVGDMTVAHSLAYARACESALDTTIPERAAGLRAIMGELERIALHLDALGRLSELTGQAQLHTRCTLARETLARLAEACFGHRLMMDAVVPGGLTHDISAEGLAAIAGILDDVAADLPVMSGLLDSASLAGRQDGLGDVGRAEVAAWGVGGVIGRAAGHPFDARVFDPIFADLALAPALETGGDAAARSRLRIEEIVESIRLVRTLLGILPDGPVSAPLPLESGEGLACVESGRGDVWHWVRLDHGRVATVFPRDPGWAAWPLAERILAGADPEDVPLIRCSLGLSSAGVDL
ncbi:MAG: nickel-dependent hydrogenase large subunit [Acetobacteraceae bacterium]